MRRLGWWSAFAIEGYFFFGSIRIAKEDRTDTKWQWKMTDFLKDGTSNVEYRRARESDEGTEMATRNGRQDTDKGQ